MPERKEAATLPVVAGEESVTLFAFNTPIAPEIPEGSVLQSVVSPTVVSESSDSIALAGAHHSCFLAQPAFRRSHR